jgi:hypothetical protein
MDEADGRTVTVARTRDAVEAHLWVDMLRDDGIHAVSFEQSVRGALGGATLFGGMHHIVVRRTDVATARSIIARAGGAHALAPIPTQDTHRDRMVRALLLAGGVAVGFLLLFTVVQVVAG